MPKEYQRTDRIADVIWHELASLLKKNVKDPRLGEITITRVTISRDLSHAKIYFTLLKEDTLKETQKALKKAAGYFRYQIAQKVNLRVTPELRFIYDEDVKRATHMITLIDEVMKKEKGSHE